MHVLASLYTSSIISNGISQAKPNIHSKGMAFHFNSMKNLASVAAVIHCQVDAP